MPPKPITKPKLPTDIVSIGEKLKLFLAAHWRGLFVLITPIVLIFMLMPFPGEKYMWVAYTLVIMAGFWVTECIPLPITGFIPVVVFPLRGVMTTHACCKTFVNDTIVMFVGSLFLANSVEQSGFHKRLAYFAIRMIGYSHFKLIFAMCVVTTFASMWITNTAATSMMIPINFAVLRVFEEKNIIKIFEVNKATGDTVATDITCCYFCAATYSATIGGIGTLVGTGTNLVFKGLFMDYYPEAPEYLSFPLFSAFAVPYMFILETCLFFWIIFYYLGFMRPNSAAAKRSKIPEEAKVAARAAIEKDTKALGPVSFWEVSVVILFGGAMISFFCRSPQIFVGWADVLNNYFAMKEGKYIRDSALAMFVSMLMFILPSNLSFFKNFSAQFSEELPKTSITSILDWHALNRHMPYSFMFLLGGGFSLSNAAKDSGLNDKLGEMMSMLNALPLPLVMFLIVVVVVFVTNFAANVAVANVFVPVAMNLAVKLKVNPLWYCVAAGFSASYCFMLPVGTPGNLIVQSAAKVPTGKMIVAGSGPTILTICITWVALYVYAPVVWPELHNDPTPSWIKA